MFFKNDNTAESARLEVEWRRVLDDLLEILGGQTMFEAILVKLNPQERDELADLIIEAAQLRLAGNLSTDRERMKQIRELCDRGWARLEWR
jgi:DNA-directed RNA polymerase subunit F